MNKKKIEINRKRNWVFLDFQLIEVVITYHLDRNYLFK